MVHSTWLKDDDFSWFQNQIPKYNIVHQLGKARKKNDKKDAFLEQVYLEYSDKFPGRMQSWSLSQIGTGGTEEQRKTKIIQRFRDWFSNHTNNNAGNGHARKDNPMELMKVKGSRREIAHNTYYRLYRDTLQTDIDADYTKYKDECTELGLKAAPPAGRRNHYLAERYKNESEEVRNRVEAERKEAGDDGAGRRLEKITSIPTLTNESDRLECVRLLQKNINMLLRTIETAADTIVDETGWNVAILVGGPEPEREGNIRVMWTTRGAIKETIPFEQYNREWGNLTQKFASFCAQVMPEDIRAKYSLAVTEGREDEGREDGKMSNQENLEKCNSPEKEDDARARDENIHSNAVNSEIPKVDKIVDNPSSTASPSGISTITTTQDDPQPLSPQSSTPALPEKELVPIPAVSSTSVPLSALSVPNTVPSVLNPAQNVPEIVPADPNPAPSVPNLGEPIHSPPNSNPHPPSSLISPAPAPSPSPAPSPPLYSSSYPATAHTTTAQGVFAAEKVPQSTPTTTPAPAPAPSPNATCTSVEVGSPALTRSSPEPADDNANQPSISRPPVSRSTRSHAVKAAPTAAPEFDAQHWTFDAANYLKNALRHFDGKKLSMLLIDLERELGFPEDNIKSNKLNISDAPSSLRKWASKNRDLGAPPPNLSPLEFEAISLWYISLQPAVRGQSWPLYRTHLDYSDKKCVALIKGSPRGFFLLLMAISWTPVCLPDNPDKVQELVSDVIWLLQKLVEVLVHEKERKAQEKERKEKEKERKVGEKRKSSSKAIGAPSKRKRNI